jgi:hypothetical protein
MHDICKQGDEVTLSTLNSDVAAASASLMAAAREFGPHALTASYMPKKAVRARFCTAFYRFASEKFFLRDGQVGRSTWDSKRPASHRRNVRWSAFVRKSPAKSAFVRLFAERFFQKDKTDRNDGRQRETARSSPRGTRRDFQVPSRKRRFSTLNQNNFFVRSECRVQRSGFQAGAWFDMAEKERETSNNHPPSRQTLWRTRHSTPNIQVERQKEQCAP